MSVLLVVPGSLLEARSISVHHIAPGESRTFPLEVVALTDVPECRFGRRDVGVALGTVEVSFDGGGTLDTVPDAGIGPMTGPDLGALNAGDRIPVLVVYTLPAGSAGVPLARSRSIELPLGLGT